MQQLFDGDGEAVLLVDASNAFNSLNREAMLHNLQVICPAFATCVINYYRAPAALFVGGESILSTEGTTQGDPLSSAIYALIERARRTDANQIWFADDSCAECKLNILLNWWKVLCTSGPLCGYYVYAPKSWLVVKERFYDDALRLFQGTGVQVSKEGRPLLGAPLGSPTFVKEYS